MFNVQQDTRDVVHYSNDIPVSKKNNYSRLTINHKVVLQRDLGMVESFTTTLLQIYCWVYIERSF